MGALRAKKLKVGGRLKSTTTNMAGRSQSTIKSAFRVHKESREGLAEREEYLLSEFVYLLYFTVR